MLLINFGSKSAQYKRLILPDSKVYLQREVKNRDTA